MAQLQPERKLLEEDQLQGQWSTRSEPPTAPALSVIGGSALVVDGLPHTSSDDQQHQKKSVLKKVKDKAKKLKDSLTKSKKQGRDHENDVRGPYQEDDDSSSSTSDYDEESTPRTGRSVEGVTHSVPGLNASGTQHLFTKKDLEAPKPAINSTLPESISSTGVYDPQDMRAPPGTPHQTGRVLPNSFGGMQLKHGTTSTANPRDAVDFRRIEIMHLTDVSAEAPTATNVMVPEGITKPVTEKSSMESALKPVNEGNVEADVGAPPIIRQAEVALGSPNRSTPSLGHGKSMDGEGKGYTHKIYDTAGTAKDVILSKLGYGAHKSLADENDVGSPENYTTGKGYAADDLLEEVPEGEGKGYTHRIYGTPGTAKDKATGNEKLWEEGRTAKDVILSKLGYGAHKSLADENDVGSPENYTTGKSYAADDLLEEAPEGERKGYTHKIYGTPGTAKDKATGNEKLWEEGRDGEGKGYTQKLYDMAGAAKDAISSKLGYGAHKPPFLEEDHKSLTEENDVGAPESYNTRKSYAADNFSPVYGTASSPKSATASSPGYGGQSDVQRAKPTNIVEEKHVTTIYRVVGGEEGNQTVRSSMVSADIVSHGKDSVGGEYADGGESGPGGKGMVGRVTEAVSSLLGMKGGEQLSDAKQADILARKAEHPAPSEFRKKEEWTLKFQT